MKQKKPWGNRENDRRRQRKKKERHGIEKKRERTREKENEREYGEIYLENKTEKTEERAREREEGGAGGWRDDAGERSGGEEIISAFCSLRLRVPEQRSL